MKYRAKKFYTEKRKLKNGKTDFFIEITNPTAFMMKRLKRRKTK